MSEKSKIIYIHGGMTFKNYNDYLSYLKNRKISLEESQRWADDYLYMSLDKKIPIIKPYMPCKDNAQYEERRIHFENYLPYIDNNTILIGKSLGGIFLAKYLSENILLNKVLSIYLVCPPFDNTLPDEDLVGGFELSDDLSLLKKNCFNLHLIFSEDDPVVPIEHAKKYAIRLQGSELHIYNNKGHFSIEEFPEIVELLKEDMTNIL